MPGNGSGRASDRDQVLRPPRCLGAPGEWCNEGSSRPGREVEGAPNTTPALARRAASRRKNLPGSSGESARDGGGPILASSAPFGSEPFPFRSALADPHSAQIQIRPWLVVIGERRVRDANWIQALGA